jgi:DNA-directed RNA polymerase subunit RPC12/RpoP
VATPSGSVHRCPDCGGGFAERRTPRGSTERLRAALTGRRPYRCLQCGRRFHDRPANRATADAQAIASESVADPTSYQRHAYWRIDMYSTGPRPTEIYLAVVVFLIVAVVGATLLLLLWPEAVRFVRSSP